MPGIPTPAVSFSRQNCWASQEIVMEILLTEQDVARSYKIAPETLQQWRFHRRYKLPFVKIGRLVRYRHCDVEAFIQQRTQGSIEPRAFVAQRAKRKEHRAALKRASAQSAVSQQPNRKAKRHSR
jgi:hypothetical protein